MALGMAAILAFATWAACRAAATPPATMVVSVNGHVVHTLVPGARIGVTVSALPPSHRAYCLGLASMLDRYGLPVSLGRVARSLDGTGHAMGTIPPRLLPAEPAGPFLLFVGTCPPVAPDHPFVARTVIRIVANN